MLETLPQMSFQTIGASLCNLVKQEVGIKLNRKNEWPK